MRIYGNGRRKLRALSDYRDPLTCHPDRSEAEWRDLSPGQR
jgi:hypothetical protein